MLPTQALFVHVISIDVNLPFKCLGRKNWGAEEDAAMAAWWFKKAAAQGHSEAQEKVAEMSRKASSDWVPEFERGLRREFAASLEFASSGTTSPSFPII